MDTHSLAAIAEVQRRITSGDLDVDEAMHLIAARTRNVANASGVAIGLLQDDRLVYRAGTGVHATYPGREVIARLVVPAGTGMSCEILRVEDAQSDERMQAAICRQLGANALLIIVILHNRAPAAVLQIHFSQAHLFQDRELRTYRVMAGLLAEAMINSVKVAHRGTTATIGPTVPTTVEQIASPMGPPATSYGSTQSAGEPAMITEHGKRAPRLYTGWNVLGVALVTLFVMSCWIRYSLRYPDPLSVASLEQRLNVGGGNRAPSGPSEIALPKLPKPSPILAYHRPEESLPKARQPVKAMRDPTRLRTQTSRKPAPRLSSTRRSTKIHTVAIQRAPAGQAHRGIRAKSRMIVQNPKPSSPAAPKHPAHFDSEIAKSKLHRAPQESVPESSSSTAHRNESPDKGQPAETDQSGSPGFDKDDQGVDRDASSPAPAHDRRSGSSDIGQSESVPSMSNTLPPKPVSPSYNQEWRRLRPQPHSTPDESWRKRRPIDPSY